jgi:hypothetical protein
MTPIDLDQWIPQFYVDPIRMKAYGVVGQPMVWYFSEYMEYLFFKLMDKEIRN